MRIEGRNYGSFVNERDVKSNQSQRTYPIHYGLAAQSLSILDQSQSTSYCYRKYRRCVIYITHFLSNSFSRCYRCVQRIICCFRSNKDNAVKKRTEIDKLSDFEALLIARPIYSTEYIKEAFHKLPICLQHEIYRYIWVSQGGKRIRADHPFNRDGSFGERFFLNNPFDSAVVAAVRITIINRRNEQKRITGK